MKLFNNKFKSGGLHEKHVLETWNVGNHLSICLLTQEHQENPVSRWPVAGPCTLIRQIFSVHICQDNIHFMELVVSLTL